MLRLRARGDLVVGTSRRALDKVVRFRSRLVDARDGVVELADGSTLEVRVVIWATGYRSDYSWITIPASCPTAGSAHERGVCDIPGIYVLGLPWLHTRGSALLGFVDADAQHLARRIASTEPARAAAARGA